jgi:hypothetical protein
VEGILLVPYGIDPDQKIDFVAVSRVLIIFPREYADL